MNLSKQETFQLGVFSIEKQIEKLNPLLGEEERTQIALLKSPSHKLERANICARLKQVLGPQAELSHTKTGKPVIHGSDREVSYSHKSNHFALAFSDAPIGVDIELKMDPQVAGVFFNFLISPPELCLIEKLKLNYSFETIMTVFWTAKEAIFKCLDRDLQFAKVQIIGWKKLGSEIILEAWHEQTPLKCLIYEYGAYQVSVARVAA